MKELFDAYKALIERFPNTKNPILKRFKLEFDLFYETEQKISKIIDEFGTGITLGELAIKCKELGIKYEKHREQSWLYQINTPFWITLFTTEKLTINEAKASLIETKKVLIKGKSAYSQEISINDAKVLEKPFAYLTDAERDAINFNFVRQFKNPVFEYQLKIIDEFLTDYEYISPDEEFIKMVRASSLEQETENHSTNTNDKLDNNTLQFPQYLKIETPELFAEKLKNEFKVEKSKKIKLLIKSLQQENILILGERDLKVFLESMKVYFDRNLGSYQSINDFRYNENKHKNDFEAISKRLEPLIKECKK